MPSRLSPCRLYGNWCTLAHPYMVGLLESEPSFLLEPALCFVWEKVEINFSDKEIMSVIPIITLVFKRKFLLTGCLRQHILRNMDVFSNSNIHQLSMKYI